MIDAAKAERIVEAALLTADEPLSASRLGGLFDSDDIGERSAKELVSVALAALDTHTADRGYELVEVASGYRFQVRQELSPWVSRLFTERPPRYSRALLETLALIVYRQPVTRGDIEQVRGVQVSPSIMRTLTERGWIHAVGQRDTPGRPTLYGTTRRFLDHFNLKTLDDLPPIDQVPSALAGSAEGADAETPGRPAAEVVRLPVAD